MQISSPAFKDGEELPEKYTCRGEGINPPLIISDVPSNAVELVLILDDPDAPSGNFNHWVVINIDLKVNNILENSLPKGAVEGLNSASKSGYVAPCPPSGIHHYCFSLYALDSKLNLSSPANRDSVLKSMESHIILRANLVGLCKAK
ncbi:MAG: YbhB/YbcL family Raf kinase inhibitor-like protein [Candidatus Berkelbacteria bacterium]|nr:YbhB/YbcL family Raf kinase inhibitor-like protein [Candidatus Berkelbacteria bacterium]